MQNPFVQFKRYRRDATHPLIRALPAGWFLAVLAVLSGCGHPERGLLASPGMDRQPMKGVYFFPGESGGNLVFYTTHPILADDRHWNSDSSSRARVMDRLVAAHVNTIVMSWWSNMPQWSPMALDTTSIRGVLDAVQGRSLVIVPAIEVGFDSKHPEIPHWEFSTDFPSPTNGGAIAPGLVQRIRELVTIFQGRMDLWARIYDRNGDWRYAVQILHVCSDRPGTTDQQFADAFQKVADQVQSQIPIGFLLDIIGGSQHAYVASPATAGPLLEQQPSVLGVSGFESEVFSGKVINGPPCFDPDWSRCQPHDNNRDNLENMLKWKQAAVRDWLAKGPPVFLDVSNGFDGRFVWRESGAGYWGDNMNYTDDRWRNWTSQLKGYGASLASSTEETRALPAVKGITVDTWNGYTEGYAAAPSQEHGGTVYNWLMDLLEPDPRDCSHMHYVNGIRTFRVYGAICEKWIQLGADRMFGRPIANEAPTSRGRVSFFADGKAIYWSGATGAHEVHGRIAKTYWDAGADNSCLGLPISDEEPSGSGRISRFEHGEITWQQGDDQGRIACH